MFRELKGVPIAQTFCGGSELEKLLNPATHLEIPVTTKESRKRLNPKP